MIFSYNKSLSCSFSWLWSQNPSWCWSKSRSRSWSKSRSRSWSKSQSRTKPGPSPWSRSRSQTCQISGPGLGPGPGPVIFLVLVLVPVPIPDTIFGPVTQCLWGAQHWKFLYFVAYFRFLKYFWCIFRYREENTQSSALVSLMIGSFVQSYETSYCQVLQKTYISSICVVQKWEASHNYRVCVGG